MGNHPEADNEILVQGATVEANHTEDVFEFLSVGKGQVFSVKVSIEVHCEDKLEDARANMLIDFEDFLMQTMVGCYGLTAKSHKKEYKGSERLPRYGTLEGS